MTMTNEEGVRVMAGIMVLVSVGLTRFVNPNWYWLTVFVGANLLQSAFTGICPASWLLNKLGLKYRTHAPEHNRRERD